METASNNKLIAKNTVFLYIRMFFALIVTLYTSRVVLQTLGVVDFGVYNTVAGFVTMFSFLNYTLSASMQRFYNFEGARFGREGYKSVYSVGLIIHFLVVIAMLLLLETIGLWYVNNVMVVPVERLASANILFQTSVISLSLLVMSIPYTGAIIAIERMDFYAIASIVETILKLVCVLILPHLKYDKLVVYGILLLFVSIISFLMYYAYAKKEILNFSVEFKYNKSLIRQLLSFSSWNVVGTFAFMLKGQALNMLLNFFFGPVINAARGIAFQVGNAISSFSSNITVAFRPQIVTSYSQENYLRVSFLFYIQSKICFALMAILIIPLILNIHYVLELWLGDDIPEYSYIFTVLVLLDSLICSLNAPCTQVVSATGKIKGYQIASSCVNLLLLPTCWLFLYKGLNPTSTFIITVIFSILNQYVCVWQMLKVFQMETLEYLKKVIIPCLLFVLLYILPGYVLSLIVGDALISLLVITGVCVIWGLVLIYYVLLDTSEQTQIKQLIRRNIVEF